MNALFQSWTATGCLAFVLATLCTAEVMRLTWSKEKKGIGANTALSAKPQSHAPMQAPVEMEINEKDEMTDPETAAAAAAM